MGHFKVAKTTLRLFDNVVQQAFFFFFFQHTGLIGKKIAVPDQTAHVFFLDSQP